MIPKPLSFWSLDSIVPPWPRKELGNQKNVNAPVHTDFVLAPPQRVDGVYWYLAAEKDAHV